MQGCAISTLNATKPMTSPSQLVVWRQWFADRFQPFPEVPKIINNLVVPTKIVQKNFWDLENQVFKNFINICDERERLTLNKADVYR